MNPDDLVVLTPQDLGVGEGEGANDWKTIDNLPAPRRWKPRVVAVLCLVAGALAFVIYQGLSNSLVYFYTVSQAVQARAKLGSSTFRMEGVVEPRSIAVTSAGVDFSMRFANSVVKVVEIGNPPQLFQANVPVVVVGHFSGATFFSDQVLIKHSANYVAAHPNRINNPGGS